MLCMHLLVLLACASATEISFGRAADDRSKAHEALDIDYIETKLNLLEHKFLDLFLELTEQGNNAISNQRRIEEEQQLFSDRIYTHAEKLISLTKNSTTGLTIRMAWILEGALHSVEAQRTCAITESIRRKLFEPETAVARSDWLAPPCSAPSAKSFGLCQMKLDQADMLVYREQHRFEGDWFVIMQRFDGSVSFNRNWTEYRNGFGTVGQEFWFGLEKLRQLINNHITELLVEVESRDGSYEYTRYTLFGVYSEKENYLLPFYAMNAESKNLLGINFGARFSTFDRGTEKNCSALYGGGWWYDSRNCSESFTGRWSTFQESFKFVRLMMRLKTAYRYNAKYSP